MNHLQKSLLAAAALAAILSPAGAQLQQSDADTPTAQEDAGQGVPVAGAGVVSQDDSPPIGSAPQNAPAQWPAAPANQNSVAAFKQMEAQAEADGGNFSALADIANWLPPLPKNSGDQGSSKGFGGRSSSGGGSNAEGDSIVATALAFMANPPYNPDNGTHNWDGYCLGIVYTTLRAAHGGGYRDAQMAQGDAKAAYFAMAHANRISNNDAAMPAGAAVFWPYVGVHGHVAIYSGRVGNDGSPLIITNTGWGGMTNIHEISVKRQGLGMPTGWGKI